MMKSKKRDWCFLYFCSLIFVTSPLKTVVLSLLQSGYFINSSEEVLAGLKMIG
ncbi:hypothetical protein [Bartonella apis]|uniref:hypothetical protein n=1 Tax=Bartonella apis TaxID=1686310 RepID=UPI00242F7DFE|nr:hypothetical protein [Bartonella apis]